MLRKNKVWSMISIKTQKKMEKVNLGKNNAKLFHTANLKQKTQKMFINFKLS